MKSPATSFDSHKTARLFAALDAAEGMESLLDQIRQNESLPSRRSEIQDVAERMMDVRDRLLRLVFGARQLRTT